MIQPKFETAEAIVWTQDCLLLSEKEMEIENFGQVVDMRSEERELETEREAETRNESLLETIKVQLSKDNGKLEPERTNDDTNEKSASDSKTMPRNERDEVLTKTNSESGKTTPPKKMQTAEEIITQIISTHSSLKEFEAISLEPRPEINELFGRLVGIAILPVREVVAERIMSDSRIVSILPSLHNICSQAESALESYWSLKISSASSPTTPSTKNQIRAQTSTKESKQEINQEAALTLLKQFPYYRNYTALTCMEIHALQGVLPTLDEDESEYETSTKDAGIKLQKIAFIGSGPLPLTSLCLLQHPSVQEILNIDCDPTAITQSTHLCSALPSSYTKGGMEFASESATDPSRDLMEFDVVFIAALVGSTQGEKESVVRSVVGRMRKGALVVIRTAGGLRRLLYGGFEFGDGEGEGEGIDENKGLGLSDVMRIEVVVMPWGEVVNGVGVGRVL